MPTVSVVISTYDRREMLEEALASALAQRDVDVEVIVVDNGSTDDTARFLASVDDPRLVVLRHERSLGPVGGRNSGLAIATGEWVGILDDDDVWAPDKLRAQLDEAEATDRDWVCCGCVYVDGRGRVLGGREAPTADELVATLPFAYTVPGGMSGMLWRRAALDGDGLLDPELRWQTDWDVSLRLLRAGPPAVVRRPLVGYRQHRGQVSRDVAARTEEIDRVEAKTADLRPAGRGVDRGAQHRFLAGEALRGGHRRAAIVAYLRGLREGDLGCLVRLPATVLPRAALRPTRQLLLSDADWVSQTDAWLPAAVERSRRPTVVIVWQSLRQYRVRFLELLRQRLEADGIDLRFLHSTTTLSGTRTDAGELPWAEEVPGRRLRILGKHVVWQPVLGDARDADLIVVDQKSRMLANYALQLLRRTPKGPLVAFWGHGANLDVEDAHPVGETVKRFVTRHADWWFAYTEGSADLFAEAGADPDRITVFRNATDTRSLAEARAAVAPDGADRLRQRLELPDGPLLLFIGNPSEEKRLDLLVAAAERLRDRHPGLGVVLVGGHRFTPQDQARIEAASWVVHVGQRFGRDLAEVAAACQLLVIPGWAGLSVVDGFALGLPVVIARDLPHPPEADYVTDGLNGLAVDGGSDPDVLAAAIGELLDDPVRLRRLAAGSASGAERYTVEDMVARVADGIVAALAAGRRAGGPA